MFDQSLPHSIEAEESVIGSILSQKVFNISKDVCAAIVDIIPKPDIFYSSEHQDIWKVIITMVKESVSIDSISLLDYAKKHGVSVDPGTIALIISKTHSASNIVHHATIIYENYLLRDIIERSIKIANKAYSGNEKTFKLLEETHDVIGELINLKPGIECDFDSDVDRTIESVSNKNEYIPFGFPKLDKAAGGKFRQENTIIAGRPGHLKTTLIANMMYNDILNGYRVMVFSREMSNKELIKKIIVMRTGISYGKIIRKTYTEEELKRFIDDSKELKELVRGKLKMFDNIFTLPETFREIRRFKPDVVYDDYIQLIRFSDGKKLQRREEIEMVSHEYKRMAKSLNFAAVLASQLRRIEDRTDQIPRISDLKESGAIEEDAATVLMLYYEYKIKPETATLGKYGFEIIMGKARFSDTSRGIFGINGDRCKIYNELKDVKLDQQRS